MYNIEPFYNWIDFYDEKEDPQSLFLGMEDPLNFEDHRIYNYIIHPAWSYFGSNTLYLKVLFLDYNKGYAIIEFLGEWNDVIENDIMTLYKELLEPMIELGLTHFLFICESVLNFHFDIDDYYNLVYEDLLEWNGELIFLNFPEYLIQEIELSNLKQNFKFLYIDNWRNFIPDELCNQVFNQQTKIS